MKPVGLSYESYHAKSEKAFKIIAFAKMPGEQTENAGAKVATSVIVHPLVLLSTVDHYSRGGGGPRKRVMGVLLGDVSKGVVDVTNSFAGSYHQAGQRHP